MKKEMLDIIDSKYEKLGLNNKNKNDMFWKIKEFEANAVGQIGEEFIKKIFEKLNIVIDDVREVIHDEYDILSNNKKIEIKTARKGRTNNTFQFNGINPKYNYDYVILLGILNDDIIYKIINKNKIKYIHKDRKYYVQIDSLKKKSLVKMNPNNEVNFKLTLNVNEMISIEFFESELLKIFNV